MKGDVYIPNVGFRQAGVRLERPVSIERDGRTLTIRDLVATEKGTDLLYEFTCLPEECKDPQILGRGTERAVLNDGRPSASTLSPFLRSPVIAHWSRH